MGALTFMAKKKSPPVTFHEYERIFRTIHSVLLNEESDPTKECLFFSVVGAFLLAEHHGLRDARPMAGFAAYNLGLPTNLVLAFGSPEDVGPVSTEEAFHCWIEVEGYAIDLTVPLFDHMVPMQRKGRRIPPKSFVKTIDSRAQNAEDLNDPGEYLYRRNPSLMRDLGAQFARRPALSDLANICGNWYRRPPKAMRPFVVVTDGVNRHSKISLSPIRLEGAW